MHMILTEDEYLSLRARAIDKKTYEKWKSEVFAAQNNAHNTIMGVLHDLPRRLKHEQAIILKDVLGKLHEATSQFPFETIIKK